MSAAQGTVIPVAAEGRSELKTDFRYYTQK
jgi:hypothetical protein